jgi:hypothetical protein
MHTTSARGHLGLKGGASRLWGIAALCGLPAVIAIAAVGTSPALAASKWYTICTHTSNVTDAGTDSNVEVRLWGTQASSTKVDLDNSDDNFERGRWDCFGLIFSDPEPFIRCPSTSAAISAGALTRSGLTASRSLGSTGFPKQRVSHLLLDASSATRAGDGTATGSETIQAAGMSRTAAPGAVTSSESRWAM